MPRNPERDLLWAPMLGRVLPYGEVSSSWQKIRGILHVTVQLPPNTTGTVTLPGAAQSRVLEDGQPIVASDGVYSVRQSASDVIVEVGSGSYDFGYRAD